MCLIHDQLYSTSASATNLPFIKHSFAYPISTNLDVTIIVMQPLSTSVSDAVSFLFNEIAYSLNDGIKISASQETQV